MTNRGGWRTSSVVGVLAGLLGAIIGFFSGLMITLMLWVALPDVDGADEPPIGLLGLVLVTVVPAMMLIGTVTAVILFLRRADRR